MPHRPPTVRETVRVILLGVAVMLAVPLSYRIWLEYHPQPVTPRQTLTQYFEKTAADNTLRLLKTPLAKWMEHERTSEPAVCDWLKSHEKTVLPWEWTDEARRKDPDGYRALWVLLFKEMASDLKARLKTEQTSLKAIERDLSIAETIYAHRTNQLAHVLAVVATNRFPMTIRIERLTKGRLWGWNTRSEMKTFERADDLEASEKGWLAVERRQIREDAAAMTDRTKEKHCASDRATGLQSLASRAEANVDLLLRAQPDAELEMTKELLRMIEERFPLVQSSPPDGKL